MKITLPRFLGLILAFFMVKSCITGTPTKSTSAPQRASTPAISYSYQPAPAPTAAPKISDTPKAITTIVRYVGPKSLNVRTGPSGGIVGSISHATSITVYEEKDGWSRTTPDGAQERWVSSSHLCINKDCSDIPKWKTPPPPAPRAVRRTTSSSSYSCPCSSSRNCFGPRGGRYCITSGGNKRYR